MTQARGGTGNDIRLLVIDERNQIIFDSGQQHAPRANVLIEPSHRYQVLLDNRFSALSQKTVVASVFVDSALSTSALPQSSSVSASKELQPPTEGQGLVPPRSRIYVADTDALGTLFRAALTKHRVPLIVASDPTTAPYLLKQAVHLGMLTLSLVEASTGDILFTCNADKLDTLKDRQSAADQCAKELHEQMQR